MGWVLLVVVFVMFSGAAAWAANPKFGYFDLQTILDQSKYGKQAKEDFRREKDKIKNDMDDKARTFKTAKDEFDKKKSVMDEAAKNKKTKEIQEMQLQGEKFIMESNTKLNKLSSELMDPIVARVLEIVRKIGKDDKYDYIFEVGKGGIVWANDKDDLTKRLTDELDKSPMPTKK